MTRSGATGNSESAGFWTGWFLDRLASGQVDLWAGREAVAESALIHHYFGSKDQLFGARVAPPVNPSEVMSQVAESVPEQCAEFILRAMCGYGSFRDGLAGALIISQVSGLLVQRCLLRIEPLA